MFKGIHVYQFFYKNFLTKEKVNEYFIQKKRLINTVLYKPNQRDQVNKA